MSVINSAIYFIQSALNSMNLNQSNMIVSNSEYMLPINKCIHVSLQYTWAQFFNVGERCVALNILKNLPQLFWWIEEFEISFLWRTRSASASAAGLPVLLVAERNRILSDVFTISGKVAWWHLSRAWRRQEISYKFLSRIHIFLFIAYQHWLWP